MRTVTGGKPTRARQALFWSALGAVVVLGLCLRIGGSLGELWLDELWSLMLVAPLKSAGQVFTGIRHENNHYLLSLWIWLCGPDRSWWVYRVPSIVAGTLGVVAAIRIGLRQSQATALVGGVLISLSYLGVFYSSEARGYAVACCMALVAHDGMEVYLKGRRWWAAAEYGAAVLLGMMGSLSFASVLAAMGLWSAASLLWRELSRKTAVQFVLLHVTPAVLLGALWLVDIRKMAAGDGPEVPLWAVLRETVGYGFGLRGDAWIVGWLVVGVFGLLAWQTIRMARNGDLRWVVFAVGVLIGPAALLVATARVYIYPRYFVANVYLLYLLIALALGKVWDRAVVRQRLLVGVMLGAWALANGLLDVELLRIGRGHYLDALRFIAENSPGRRPQIGSTQDFRTGVLVSYYRKYLPEAAQPEVLPAAAVPQVRPEWVLSTFSPYEVGASQRLPERLGGPQDLAYVLVREYPSTALSGFAAGVYRRADLVPAKR